MRSNIAGAEVSFTEADLSDPKSKPLLQSSPSRFRV